MSENMVLDVLRQVHSKVADSAAAAQMAFESVQRQGDAVGNHGHHAAVAHGVLRRTRSHRQTQFTRGGDRAAV